MTKVLPTKRILQILGVNLDDGDVNKNEQNKKILVVEDSHTQRIIICRMLKQNGYDIVEASDGYEALGQLDKEKPDLILLDVLMPGIDGFKVVPLIKAKPGMRKIPIIMLTARDNLIDKMRGKDSGINEYLTKPFVHDIREAINAVADGKVDAAIIPTFMVSKYKFLKIITTTKSMPNIALSVSPTVPTDIKKSMLNALLNAEKSIEGRSMLKHIGLTEFADASDTKYTGYSQLLEGMFGYQPSVKLKMAVRN